jgi:hypothetical protein
MIGDKKAARIEALKNKANIEKSNKCRELYLSIITFCGFILITIVVAYLLFSPFVYSYFERQQEQRNEDAYWQYRLDDVTVISQGPTQTHIYSDGSKIEWYNVTYKTGRSEYIVSWLEKKNNYYSLHVDHWAIPPIFDNTTNKMNKTAMWNFAINNEMI